MAVHVVLRRYSDDSIGTTDTYDRANNATVDGQGNLYVNDGYGGSADTLGIYPAGAWKTVYKDEALSINPVE